MMKIPTLFERVDNLVVGVMSSRVDQEALRTAIATEKVNGTNVRVTIRNTVIVRVEKRRNPTWQQKESAILNPWYVDAHEDDPNDRWLYSAIYPLDSLDRSLPDGEYEAEAYGENIQGNPLGVEGQRLYWFSVRERSGYWSGTGKTFDELRTWAASARSIITPNNVRPEGLVWHDAVTWRPIAKIKLKDFGIR